MAEYRDTFFDEERPWSRLKNRILESYVEPYLAKVNKRREHIVLVDAFAGPGKGADGAPGSPLIICEAAERRAKGKYSAYFFNNDPDHHRQLSDHLGSKGYSSATPILGDAIALIKLLTQSLSDHTLFLYVDPFGLDCEFDVLIPLLEREKRYSTEILINLQMPIIHRLACKNTCPSSHTEDARIRGFHDKLSRTLGGEYWKQEMWSEPLTAKERENQLIARYRHQLSSTGYLTWTGACPIRERIESQTKYFMVFASPHPDALLLLNDTMCKSFQDYMHNQWAKDTIFAESSWTEWRDHARIDQVVLQYVGQHDGSTRKDLWYKIVADHFMLFTEAEYRQTIKRLCDSQRIECVTPIVKGGTRPTKSLNDNCVFKLPDQQSMF
ncbi:MAG: three-Cys-motif partner protein TcmP [Chloroflexi bacterium]|nr:three-Cys-motif partner protein TcmP [Chloroflexota bacterium]